MSTGGKKAKYGEGVLVGYRHYDTKKVKPLFPFGHGLSYTEFGYSDLTIDCAAVPTDGEINISFNVTNTGDIAGKDVVEVYFSAPYTSGGIEK